VVRRLSPSPPTSSTIQYVACENCAAYSFAGNDANRGWLAVPRGMVIAASMRVEGIIMRDRVTTPTVLPIFIRTRMGSGHIQAHTSAHHTRILVHLDTALAGVGEGISADNCL
jgi:hypothetical protein